MFINIQGFYSSRIIKKKLLHNIGYVPKKE